MDKILLSDLNIIYERIKDFKYTPLKLFEMIKESEKFRGVDFNIQYSQINNKKYWYKCEVTIFSQKLGIKAQGYGNNREEAGNKCAIILLEILFQNKFKTFYELNDYFQNKNGRYLDILLLNENK